MANTTVGTAVAERPADSVWLSTLPTPRIAAVSGLVSAARPSADLLRAVTPAAGVLSGLPGAVTDLAVSHDGRYLVAAHLGADAVSVIDIATLSVHSVTFGISEPYAVAVSDRVYVGSASLVEDSVVAIDMQTGSALAARDIGEGAPGMAVSRSGELVYAARSADGVAEIAVVDVESGHLSTIEVSRAAGAVVETLRANAAGNRLYAAVNTATGASLVSIDVRSGRVLNTVAVGTSIADIAVHPDERRVFATGWDAELGGVLHIIDTGAARAAHTIATGGMAAQVVLTAGAAYLADGDEVVVIDTATARVYDRVDVGRAVSCLAISLDGTHLYAGDYEGTVVAMAVRTADLRAAS